jgi:hypothetical protein
LRHGYFTRRTPTSRSRMYSARVPGPHGS